ncbi:MAG: sugar ABC transporter ATP-binding protein, partial [Halanaerobiales bacterium]
MSGNKVLEMKNIYKNYGGIEALINVDFSVEEGEIHALCGENGAGKSTLIKILTGAEIPDEGQVFINGEEVHFSHPTNAQGHNIGVIYQEFALVPDLSIAENVFLGHRLSNGVNGLVPWEKLRSEAEKVLERLGIKNIDVEQKVSDVSVAYQQLVEIAKAITRNVKILILDEPTSALPPSEVDKLFEVMEALKREGVVMVFISHKLEEVMKICDRVTVLKDGEKMGTREIEETNEKELINLMIGRDLADEYPEKNNEVGDKILEVNNLSGENKYPKEASLYVREGEIIGLSGLVGCGRTELVRCLF